MQTPTTTPSPRRITDVLAWQRQGARVSLETTFEIREVEFRHREIPFKAHIFLCRYTGLLDDKPFSFRKCYARGCHNNLCPHVTQAVVIANRYLKRDYQKLRAAGIDVEEHLFVLAEMLVEFERAVQAEVPVWSLPDLIAAAKAGKVVRVETELSFMPAVEFFDRQQQAQTYLTGEFAAMVEGDRFRCERCLACFPTEGDAAECRRAVEIADARLELLFADFHQNGIAHQRRYFKTIQGEC